MNPQILKKTTALAAKVDHVFVTTADGRGLPHVAAAGGLGEAEPGRVAVTAWFCPVTVANLQRSPDREHLACRQAGGDLGPLQNGRTGLVVWDAATDEGLQLLGEVKQICEVAVLDGCDPQLEGGTPSPQAERKLIVRVDKVLRFSRGPHSDVEE